MSFADCPTRRTRIPHDLSPDIQIMELVSDGGSSLYQIQVNGVPDGELHLGHIDPGDSAYVVYEQAGRIINGILIATIGKGWWLNARKDVERFLECFYRDAIVSWYTKGAYIE